MSNALEDFIADPAYGELPFPKVQWQNRFPQDMQRAFLCSLPYGLADGRIVDGPGPVLKRRKGLFTNPLYRQFEQNLCETWGFADPDDARAAIASLLSTDSNPEYVALLPEIKIIAQEHNPETAHALVEPACQRLPGVDPSAITAVLQKYANLFAEGMGLPSQLPSTLTSWDYGRAAWISRMAHGIGWFSEEECAQHHAHALERAQVMYPDWKSYASGWLLGRAAWSGMVGEDGEGLSALVATLLVNPASPWLRMPLNP
ncbi:DUF1266 domain-containing protein [Corynebacterium liangguodongii]|uniref:DUF1266 domain-containing protein n=1 Tax=Corynebacterium liangguodongii TaxID=2079535 RepID=A0A2S0WC80_9CORY|nr:DUF1266 domain-containing protein [Corynebacterium liangguodongii]AWB83354.1 hypothetical protein C3E79_01680 [Corynebacterium liangguodongii]PWC00556.1 DUF1266 domain-containing protein [Corynebacterium liangguodongii]